MLSKGLSKVVTLGCKACGLALILSGIAGHAAAVDIVPEIDPGSATSALTLLVGGVLMLTDRIRRK